MAQVSTLLGDTLLLTVRTGLDTLCVARRIGPYPIQVLSVEVGRLVVMSRHTRDERSCVHP